MAPLPLFPLPVVLLPGTAMPLHVFEPRYRQMLADCLERDTPFGVLPQGEEPAGPPPGTVGCRAVVERHMALPDGRSNILVAGTDRFRLLGYLDHDRQYLLGEVEDYQDIGPVADSEMLQLLRGDVEAWLASDRDEKIEWSQDPSAFTFQVAAALPIDQATRQRLLQYRSSAERAMELALLLPKLQHPPRQGGDFQRIASTNGRAPGDGTGHDGE